MTTITICLIMYTLYQMIPDSMKQAADEVDVAKCVCPKAAAEAGEGEG